MLGSLSDAWQGFEKGLLGLSESPVESGCCPTPEEAASGNKGLGQWSSVLVWCAILWAIVQAQLALLWRVFVGRIRPENGTAHGPQKGRHCGHIGAVVSHTESCWVKLICLGLSLAFHVSVAWATVAFVETSLRRPFRGPALSTLAPGRRRGGIDRGEWGPFVAGRWKALKHLFPSFVPRHSNKGRAKLWVEKLLGETLWE